MKLLNILAMHGPNFWSTSLHNLIVAKIDVEQAEFTPTNKINNVADTLLAMLPSLEHDTTGFTDKLREGMPIANVIERIAVEIQALAGIKISYSATHSLSKAGIYTIVYDYEEEDSGRYAIDAAVSVVEAAICSEPCNVEVDIAALRHLYGSGRFGVSTRAIAAEAQKRDIPVIRLNEKSLLQLGYGSRQQRIEATTTGRTSNIAVEIAGDKEETKSLLKPYNIPVPSGETVSSEIELLDAIKKIGFPIVIKPLDGNHGRGTTVDIRTPESALLALRFAMSESRANQPIVEKFITGSDYRILVVNYKFTAAARRVPARITGDGFSTIAQLIAKANDAPRRATGHQGALTFIEMDEVTQRILDKQQLTPESVLPENHILVLKMTANISTGGTAQDITDSIHPDNIQLAERIARIIGLDICGLDIISPDLSQPLLSTGGTIIEVNAGPGLRMHLQPD